MKEQFDKKGHLVVKNFLSENEKNIINFNYLNLPFPLAISFFTFQQITYLVDCFNNVIKNITIETLKIFSFIKIY